MGFIDEVPIDHNRWRLVETSVSKAFHMEIQQGAKHQRKLPVHPYLLG
jgi:hypothetical protein